MQLHSRLSKLEARKRVKRYFSLYDGQGNKVDAIIKKMPTKDNNGLALLPDGSTREIHCMASVKDILLSIADYPVELQELESPPEFNEYALFLRINDKKCGVEILLGFHEQANQNEDLQGFI